MRIASPVEEEMKRIGWRVILDVRILAPAAANDAEVEHAAKKDRKNRRSQVKDSIDDKF